MKCPNCGAEVGKSKYCEYCGSQISSNMRREQEQVNKQGCPRCGSSNITFKRETQGEVRGKRSKQVIHRTVGICKDCGASWYPNSAADEVPRTNKIWLWVLGWICIFPIPLTILLLRQKKMKPVLKYGIIALAWIIYLIIGISGRKTTEANYNTMTQSVTQTAVDKLDVTLEVEPNVNTEDASVLFGVKTNLPEGTKINVTVSNETYSDMKSTVVLATGYGYTSEFEEDGHGLHGTYTVKVTMALPTMQDDSVKAIIGENGENLNGQYVRQSAIEGVYTIQGSFEFTFE